MRSAPPRRITHTTKIHEISLTVEPITDDVMGLEIRDNKMLIAQFELGVVWDFLKESLRELQQPTQFVGLERRCYEASNIHRLTGEWVKMKKKEEE